MHRAEPRARPLAALAALAALTAAVLATVAVVGWRARTDPGTAWLPGEGPARWIVYPLPADLRARPLVEMSAEFRSSFDLEAPPSSALLRIRAFRRAQVFLNGRGVPLGGAEAGWKTERRADVAGLLRPGRNDLLVIVGNDDGPPALWAVVSTSGQPMTTDAAWKVSLAGSGWRNASLASEPMGSQRVDPEGRLFPPFSALRLRWASILASVLVAGAVAAWGARLERRRVEVLAVPPPAARILSLGIGAVAALWIALLWNNAGQIPLQIGFDAGQHLEYVQYVLREHAIPLANQGWQMFQPPLYYVLTAFGLGAAGLDTSSPAAYAVVRAIGLACGVGNVVLVGLFLRRLLPSSPWSQLAGLIVAGFLPPMLYLAHLPTNEPLAAALSSGALLLTCTILDSEEWSFGRAASLGVVLGLALLAKFSTLLVLASVLVALVARVLSGPKDTRPRGWTRVATVVAAVLAVSGWHFARVWLTFGDPFVGGWEARPGLGWWLDPGYRTLEHFTRFGHVLSQPVFAGLHGLWDGLYSTMWGDGMLSGLASTAPVPPWWSPDLHAAGYALALVPSCLIVVGLAATVVRSVRRPSAIDALLVFLPALILAALVIMSVRVPTVAQDKAFYGLMGLAPLAAMAGRGMAVVSGGRSWRRVVLLALLGAWAATAYRSLWMSRRSESSVMIRAVSQLGASDEKAAAATLREFLAREPDDWRARIALARVLIDAGAPDLEVAALLRPADAGPDLAARHVAIALAADARRDTGAALAAALRAISIDPGVALAWELAAQAREDRDELPEAISAWRQVLGLEPQSRKAHLALARLYEKTMNTEAGRFHRSYAARLIR